MSNAILKRMKSIVDIIRDSETISNDTLDEVTNLINDLYEEYCNRIKNNLTTNDICTKIRALRNCLEGLDESIDLFIRLVIGNIC